MAKRKRGKKGRPSARKVASAKKKRASPQTPAPASKVSVASTETLPDWLVAAQKAARRWNRSAKPEARAAVVDRLVLAFGPVKLADKALAKEVAAIHQALGAQDAAQIEAALRPLGAESPLADWKRLLESLSAWQAGDDVGAMKGFRPLQGTRSVPGRAAAAFVELLDQSEVQAPSPNAMALACHCLGQSEAVSTVAAADEAWRKQDWAQVHACLLKHQPAFPSARRVGLWGALTDQFYDRANKGRVAFLEAKVQANAFASASEKAVLLRWQALQPGGADHPNAYASRWCRFAAAYEAACGEHPALVARVHAKIGHDLLHQGPHIREGEPPSHELCLMVLHHLKKCVALEPNHLPAYLDMLDAHRALDDQRSRNKLLEKLTKLFPKENRFLLEAGRQCVQRKAYVKGLTLLRQALQADPHDRDVRAALMHGLGDQAFRCYLKGELKRGRACFAEMEAVATPDADDYDAGLPYVLVRQHVCECCFLPDEVILPTLASRALEQLSEHTWQFANYLVAGLVYENVPHLRRKAPEVDSSYLSSAEANGRDALRMIALVQHWHDRMPSTRESAISEILQAYLQQVIKLKAFTREEAREIVLRQRHYHYSLLGDDLAAVLLEQDPEDPFFCIAAARAIPLVDLDEDQLNRLKRHIDRAAGLHDEQAVAMGTDLLTQWQQALHQVMDGPIWESADDEPWDDSGSDDFDEESANEVENLEREMPGITRMLKEIALRDTPERERLRREIGVSKPVFEDFVHMAEQLKAVGYFDDPDLEDPLELGPKSAPASVPPRTEPKRTPSSGPPPDQLDLFR